MISNYCLPTFILLAFSFLIFIITLLAPKTMSRCMGPLGLIFICIGFITILTWGENLLLSLLLVFASTGLMYLSGQIAKRRAKKEIGKTLWVFVTSTQKLVGGDYMCFGALPEDRGDDVCFWIVKNEDISSPKTKQRVKITDFDIIRGLYVVELI